MKSPVSSGYVIVITLLAASAAGLSYVTGHPAFSLASLLLGIYALHLVSVRIVIRQYAGVSPPARSKRGQEAAEEVRKLQEEIDLERRELENQKAELQKRIVAAEQQWELLRQMIRARVEGAGAVPDSVVARPESGLAPKATSLPGGGNGSDDAPRIHGRW